MIDVVVYSDATAKSANKLADALGVRAINGWSNGGMNLRGQKIFNYGCSLLMNGHYAVNHPAKTEICIDKVSTFQVLKHIGAPVPAFVTSKHQVPKDWEHIVCRQDPRGCKNEGMDIVEQGQPLPDAKLFTKYFYYKREYRIVVFRNKVIARYAKEEDGNGSWTLEYRDKKGFEQIDLWCERSAKALEIDYVGFDVVCVNKKNFVILEANTGPILTEEVLEYLVKKLKG